MLDVVEVTILTCDCTDTALVECACDESIKSSSLDCLCVGSEVPAELGSVDTAPLETLVS